MKSSIGEHLLDVEERLHQAAIRETGLSDFGDAGYREALRMLLTSMRSDLKFGNEEGRRRAEGAIVGALVGRLYSQRGWNRHPGCLANAVRNPIIITGAPRTGTTALHKLLSMDPQFQGIENWLVRTPMPRPPSTTWDDILEYRQSIRDLEAFYRAVPGMKAAHDMVVREVDECLIIMAQTFVSNLYPSMMPLPTYDAWLAKQTLRPSFERYADNLRLIGMNDTERRWLLKNPSHVASLAALLDVFPDACIVHTHRDPRVSMASHVHQLMMVQRTIAGEHASQQKLNERECEFWSTALRNALRVRKQRPGAFCDVEHEEFLAAPMQTVERIYSHLDVPLSTEARKRMSVWLLANPQHKHGEHRYSAGELGVGEEVVSAFFKDYMSERGYR